MPTSMPQVEQCVPLASLAQPDDTEQMQTPVAGDSGTMQVDYTISRVEGENAYIKATAINGNPISEKTEELPESPEAMGASLKESTGGQIPEL